MQNNYEFNVIHPNLDKLGYVIAVADMNEKHDRSAPSHYHWKILKCRMLLFSNSSILACPDKNNAKQVHIVFNKVGDDYDKINSLFMKFSLTQNGGIRSPTAAILELCFHYTLTAKLAPLWNTLGYNYLVNNRDFLTASGPQDGLRYHIASNDKATTMHLKPVKINLLRSDEDFSPGEWVRVLPSLNKAVIDECHQTIPASGSFKSYKDLRRHWKNIHGYRLPEEESPYCSVQFWQGVPLTYPKICVTRNYPIITPLPKTNEKHIIARFLECLQSKMNNMLGGPLVIQDNSPNSSYQDVKVVNEYMADTQAVSLCTPTQMPRPQR